MRASKSKTELAKSSSSTGLTTSKSPQKPLSSSSRVKKTRWDRSRSPAVEQQQQKSSAHRSSSSTSLSRTASSSSSAADGNIEVSVVVDSAASIVDIQQEAPTPPELENTKPVVKSEIGDDVVLGAKTSDSREMIVEKSKDDVGVGSSAVKAEVEPTTTTTPESCAAISSSDMHAMRIDEDNYASSSSSKGSFLNYFLKLKILSY